MNASDLLPKIEERLNNEGAFSKMRYASFEADKENLERRICRLDDAQRDELWKRIKSEKIRRLAVIDLLQALLGWLGIARFMLGDTKLGLLKIGFTLLFIASFSLPEEVKNIKIFKDDLSFVIGLVFFIVIQGGDGVLTNAKYAKLNISKINAILDDIEQK